MDVQLRRNGIIRLPLELRRKYNLTKGDLFTLIDLGEGTFRFVPGLSQVDRLGDQLPSAPNEAGDAPDDMQRAPDEKRQRLA
jgi:bifunctional DNA-binding transcriptional regulator/antitoxin component of YhaV-PrlF toxin-antitoxin module